MQWQVLQVVDSSFPTGGFAHSGGLEAAVQHGVVRSTDELRRFVVQHLWNAGAAVLPFVGAAHDSPEAVGSVDALFDATLINHVANRASRTQGRAFYSTCEAVFAGAIAEMARAVRSAGSPAHLAPAFGACMRILGAERRETLSLFLFLSLRGATSAAVRLGAMGPLEAQRMQSGHGATIDAVVSRCEHVPADESATVSPLLDVVGALHDRLYSRLFQS
jgi:urease accessory protein